MKYGVKIVLDEDYYIGTEDVERKNLREGIWTAYGVIAVAECDHGFSGEGPSVWGVVVDTTTLEGCTVWDLAEIGDDYLREIARQEIDEFKLELEDRAAVKHD